MFIKNIAPTILTVLYIQWDPLNCGRWRRHCQSLTINLLSDSVYICTVHSTQFLYFMFFKSYFECNNRLLTLHFPWFSFLSYSTFSMVPLYTFNQAHCDFDIFQYFILYSQQCARPNSYSVHRGLRIYWQYFS